MGNAPLGCEDRGFVSILIHEPYDWESSLFVCRQMRGANDATSPDDNDGTELPWPRLPDGLNRCGNARFKVFSGGGIRHNWISGVKCR